MLVELLTRKSYDAVITGVILSVNTVTKKAIVDVGNRLSVVAAYEVTLTDLAGGEVVLLGRAGTSYAILQRAEGDIPSEVSTITV